MQKKQAKTAVIADTYRVIACLFLIPSFLILLSWTQAKASELEVLMEDFPPFNYVENGKVEGFTVDIVRELLDRTEFEPEGGAIKVLPWKRAYIRAQGDKPVLLLTTTRTEEREDMFNWVGPLYRREQWLYRRAGDEDVQVNGLDDLRGYSIAVVTESANNQLLREGGYVSEKDIYSTSSIDSKIKMLLHGRVQIAPFLPLEVAHALGQQQISVDAFEKLILLSGKYTYYLAISLSTPDETVRKLQQAFDTMVEDGTYQLILNRHMGSVS